jgi:hypothetical protein
MLSDLNRFDLYERMGLPFPANTVVERKIVELLGTLSTDRDTELLVRYRQPRQPPPPPPP